MSFRAAVIIRCALALLFFWFGIQQVRDAGAWTGFLPEWIGYLPIPPEMIVHLNGWFEVIASVLLSLGAGTRVVAGLLGAHLLGIAITVGGMIGVRDATLAIITLALVMSPPDRLTMDARSSPSF
ncbi:DoxX family protein [Candidatus Uhrbacteria bacterium]|nr:DoxX family protein [Candidatus Uhrbacteria bacterium]